MTGKKVVLYLTPDGTCTRTMTVADNEPVPPQPGLHSLIVVFDDKAQFECVDLYIDGRISCWVDKDQYVGVVQSQAALF